MLNADPFGFARRTRGINHIGQRLRLRLPPYPLRGFPPDLIPLAIHTHRSLFPLSQLHFHSLLRQHHYRPRILQLTPHSLPWQPGLHRRVRPSSLHHSHHTHHQLHPPLHHHCHYFLFTHSLIF